MYSVSYSACSISGAMVLNCAQYVLMLFTGVQFPVSQLPALLQWFAQCLPLTRSVQAMDLLLAGETGWEIGAVLKNGLPFISECGTIILRHNRIIIYVSVHFTFGKNAGSAFAFTWMFERLCRSNRSYVFFGAQLRLRTFYMYLLRELVGQPNDPVIKIKKKDVRS